MRKLETLKVGGFQREGKKKTIAFCKLKRFFFSCYFSISPFPLHFKDDLELEVALS
jgi:hypothetical protein